MGIIIITAMVRVVKKLAFLNLKKEIYLFLFFLFLTLIYLGFNFFVYFFMFPLLVYFSKIKKINLKLLLLLLVLFSILQFSSFSDYGTDVLFMLILTNLFFYLIFLYFSFYLFKRNFYYLTIPALFYVLFYILKYLPLNNFWMNLSGFLLVFPNSISYLGSYLMVFLIILFNVLIFDFILYICNILRNNLNNILDLKFNFLKVSKYRGIGKFNVFGVLILFILFFNFFLLNFFFDLDRNLISDDKIGVLGIQGNLEQDWHERSDRREENFDLYKNLTLEGLRNSGLEKVEIVFWPEYTFTNPIEFDFYFLMELSDFSMENDVTLVVGSILLENTTKSNSRRFNTLFIFDNGNLSFYKAYEPILVLDEMAVKAKFNYPVIVENVSLGLGLCYEENFPNIYRNEVISNNASVFFTIGNQYYIKNYNGLKLSSLNSNLRAAENNRYLFRLETGGLTTVIDNNGVNLNSIPINEKGFLFYEMPLIYEKSFYSIYGGFMDLFLFMFSVLVLIFSFLIRSRY